ncbi:MAG: preprotein translocase subunit YajC [Oscillospiraceae bacterium]|nr:preprotein translocase subunit YajC [Oscillospiraceae bacterium]
MYILSAAAAADAGGVSLFSPLILCVVMLVVMYFLMIRPENKKKKAAAEMRNSLKVGDVITTIGGIVGTICAVKEQTIVMETGADRVRVEFTKWAISSKGTQSTEETPVPEKTEKKADK